jgi:hypothetical protein
LCWEFETNFSVEKSNSVHNNVKQNQNKFISYNVKNIPNDWMTDLNVINSINECINNIEYSNGSQCDVNRLYDGFVEIMRNEMNLKLESKVKIMNGTNNRKRWFKKPWWNNELIEKWNSACIAEKDYVSSKNGILKTQLRMPSLGLHNAHPLLALKISRKKLVRVYNAHGLSKKNRRRKCKN